MSASTTTAPAALPAIGEWNTAYFKSLPTPEAKAKYHREHVPFAVRIDKPTKTATVYSRKSDTYYTIRQADNGVACDCLASGRCWHIAALAMEIRNPESTAEALALADMPKRRVSPCCGADEINESLYIGGRGYVSFRTCAKCDRARQVTGIEID